MRNSLGSPGEPTWQLDKQRQQITWSTPTYRKRLMTTCRTLKKLHSSSSSSRLPLPLPPPLPLALPLALLIILPSFAPITFLETTLHVLKTEALARWGPVPPSLCAVHVPNHKKFVDHGLDGKLFGKGSEGIRDEGNTTLNKCNCCSQYDYGGHTRLHPGEHALFFATLGKTALGAICTRVKNTSFSYERVFHITSNQVSKRRHHNSYIPRQEPLQLN